MKNVFVTFMVGYFLALLTGCSSGPQITKWTSPAMRIAIDPDSVSSADYVRISEALVQSGKFFVVDRQNGFRAVVQEQNVQHFDAPERFGDAERYARIARLYGVGAVVIGNVQCVSRETFWGSSYMHCVQFLALINATTAEVIAQVKGENDDAEHYYGDIKIASDWTGTVNRLNDAIPKEFEVEKWDKRMMAHRNELKEDSIRERESRGVK